MAGSIRIWKKLSALKQRGELEGRLLLLIPLFLFFFDWKAQKEKRGAELTDELGQYYHFVDQELAFDCIYCFSCALIRVNFFSNLKLDLS